MCNRRQLFRLTVLLFFAVALSSLSANASFVILNHTARADGDRRQVDFTITFNRRPDFFHTDGSGNPINAFQYWYDSQPGGFEFAGADVAVIRGPEIRFNDDIPIRDSLNPGNVDFPNAEGWGRDRGDVPFDLTGDTIRFSVPWELLDENDARFSYRLFAFESGTLTSDVGAIMIPLPRGVWTGFALLLMLTGAGLWRRVHGRR